MEHTPNLGLKKPGLTDNILISDINENMDVLDTAVNELQNGTKEIPDLETEDKTMPGAINEVNKQLTAHLEDMEQHNQFVNGTNKKIQVVLGWNDILNCPTMEYKEVVK